MPKYTSFDNGEFDDAGAAAASPVDDELQSPSANRRSSVELLQTNNLFDAAEDGDFLQVKTLLEIDKQKIDEQNEDGKTALYLAAANGHLDIVIMLIDAGARPDLKCAQGDTALVAALKNDHLGAANYLMETKLSLTEEEESEMTLADEEDVAAFNLAIEKRYFSTLRLLVKKSFNLTKNFRHHVDKLSPLIALVLKRGNDYLKEKPDIIKGFLSKESLDIVGNDGFSALHIAVANGDEVAVQTLLRAGAGRDLEDKYGKTPIYLACLYDHVDILKILLNYEAKMQASDVMGERPLIELLDNYGIDNEASNLLKRVAPLADRLKELCKNKDKAEIVALLNDDENSDILSQALSAKGVDGENFFTYADVDGDIMGITMEKLGGAGRYKAGSLDFSADSSPASSKSSTPTMSRSRTSSFRRFSSFSRRRESTAGPGVDDGDDMSAGAAVASEGDFSGSRGRGSSLSPGTGRRRSLSGAIAGAVGRLRRQGSRSGSRDSVGSNVTGDEEAVTDLEAAAGQGIPIPRAIARNPRGSRSGNQNDVAHSF